MEGPWHTDFDTTPQYQSSDEAPAHWPPRQRQPKARSSLGQLIERSTSAPPSSSAPEDYNKPSSLVGPKLSLQGLLEQVPRGGEDAVVLQQSILGGMEEQFGGGKLFDSVDSNSGRSTAPTTMSYSDYLMTGGFMDSSSRPESTGVHSHADDLYRDFASLGINKLDGVGLTRSQSAAPMIPGRTGSTIGPPPGIPSQQHRLEHNEEDDMVSPLNHHHHYTGQRSSSADFTRGQHMTLRPSAKTLMDLIQEDHPEDRVGSNAHHYGNQDHRNASGISSRGHGGYLGKADYQSMENNKRTDSFMAYEPSSSGMMNGTMERVIPSGLSQRELMEQQLYRNHQSHMPPRQNVSPPHLTTSSASMELQHQQQPAYYRGVHPSSMQPQPQQGMQAQMLSSNHQGLYIRAAPPPPPAPEHHRYAYATVQYPPTAHPQVQQGLNYHQGSVGVDHHQQQQFVSIVPVHGGPAGQIAYWQTADGRPSGGATVAIVNAPMPGGGTSAAPLTMAHMGTTTIQEAPNGQYARPRGGGAAAGGMDKASRGKRGQTRRGNDSKHAGGTSSSPLLEQFRATKNRDWTIRQIEGHVVEFCQDQNGSRFIQQRLEVGDALEQQIVMAEVLPSIRRLRNDVFGNYVVQKLLDFGSEKIKEDIRSTLEGEMVQLSLQMYGCRVVQKAIETLNDDDLARLLLEFHHNVLSCIHDQNGNHVIQKCIEVVCTRGRQAATISTEEESRVLGKIDFIVNDVLHNTATLSCHPYGCRVLQRILEHCDHGRKTAVLDQVCKCHRKLLDDQYGNYVIQHVLQFGRQSDRDSILGIIQESGLLELSRQKFASNVVEKLLKYGNDEQRLAVVREMLKPAPDTAIVLDTSGKTRSVVLLMVRDAYANYVVQTTLDVIPESEEKRMLLNELNSHSEELRNYTFAKHIVSKLATMNDG